MKRLLAAALAGLVALALLAAAPPALAEDGASRGAISGTVGPRAADVTVVAESIDAPGRRYREDVEDGTFTLEGLLPGRYRVAFVTRGDYAWEFYPGTARQSQARTVTVRSGRTEGGIDATLDPAGTVRGTVSFTDPGSLANRPPRMVPYYLDGSTWRAVPDFATDGTIEYIAPGPFGGIQRPPQYTIAGIGPGTYALFYLTTEGHDGTASGFLGGGDDAATAAPVRVTSGQTTTADMTPRRGGTMRGRILDSAGRPVPGVAVEAYSRRDDGTWYSRYANRATTDDAGRYEIFPLDTKDYVLELQPPSGYDLSYSGGVQRDASRPFDVPSVPEDAVPVTARAAQTVEAPDEVVLAHGQLEGTVRDSVDGTGVPGMTVTARRLQAVHPGRGYSMSRTVEAVTDEAGRYSFGPVGQGYWELRANDPQGVYSDEVYVGEDSELPIDGSYLSGIAQVRSERTTAADFASYPNRPGLSDDTPVVGQTISADERDSTSSDAGWVWRRDGDVVEGREGPTYAVGPADRGARLSAEQVVARSGRDVVHRSTPTSAVSTARPTVSVAARSTGRGRVQLTIRAKAAGVPVGLVDGRVEIGRVRSGSDRITTRSMRDGSLVVTLTGQPRGARIYTARFLARADHFTASATTRRGVKVR